MLRKLTQLASWEVVNLFLDTKRYLNNKEDAITGVVKAICKYYGVDYIMSNFDNHPIYDKWQLEQGSDSIDNLVELGMLDTPDLHKETLTKGSIPPWIAYSLFSRLTTMLSEKQSDTNVDYNKVALEMVKMLEIDLNIK